WDPFVDERRVLGIRLNKFDLKPKEVGLFNAPIEVAVLNAGGNANGGGVGARYVVYTPKRIGKSCAGGLDGLLDPSGGGGAAEEARDHLPANEARSGWRSGEDRRAVPRC